MVIRLQSDSHYLTCHKKSRLLFVLFNSVRQAVTVHSPVCVVRTSHVVARRSCLSSPEPHIQRAVVIRTVTCRQFPNLTFAPRKTCHLRQQPLASLLSCHSFFSISEASIFFKPFLRNIVFFLIQNNLFLPESPVFYCFSYLTTKKYVV